MPTIGQVLGERLTRYEAGLDAWNRLLGDLATATEVGSKSLNELWARVEKAGPPRPCDNGGRTRIHPEDARAPTRA
jgi:hypothetical protein